MRLLLILLVAATLYAGQSIDLATNTGTASAPQRPQNQSVRHEFQLHDWTLPGSSKQIYYDGGDGVEVLLTTTGLRITESSTTYPFFTVSGANGTASWSSPNLTFPSACTGTRSAATGQTPFVVLF